MDGYRLEGNDPFKKRGYPSPEEVKDALRGGGEKTEEYPLPKAAVKVDVVDEVSFADIVHDNRVFGGPSRCPTCGRACDCICPGCTYCVMGRPRRDGRCSDE